MIRRYAVALGAMLALAPQVASNALAQTADYSEDYLSSDYAGSDYSGDYAAADYTLPSEGRVVLGHGRLTTNDLIGDGNDRWQTGSVISSRVVGRGGWIGALPDRPFDILEYRLGGQVMAPDDMRNPSVGDRPWAGALSFGVHTHFMRGPVEVAMGGDLVVTGKQNGLSAFQTAVHDLIGVQPASKSVLDNQVSNGVHPTLVLEAGNTMALGSGGVLRPFAEARAGAETLVRAGADLTFGSVGQGELMVRDPVTGQRYRAVSNPLAGFSYVMGGDLSYVNDSVYLPASSGVDMKNTRSRLRAGLHWQGERNAAFYGLTWMSKEFEAQDSGQVVGSMRVDIKF